MRRLRARVRRCIPTRPDQRRRFADQGGFTLLEVLVAFTVMSILLSVLFRGVVMIRAGSVAFDEHTHLEIVARDVLEGTLAQRDLRSGTYSGQREGRRWIVVAKAIDLTDQLPPPAERAPPDREAAVSQNQAGSAPGPAGTPEPPKAGKSAWTTQRLTVRVQGTGRPLEIETIRLVRGE